MIWDVEQNKIKLNGGIKPMKRERTANGTRAKLANMSHGQTVASKEQCQPMHGIAGTGGVGWDGIGKGRAHGGTGKWGKMNGAGEGKIKKGDLKTMQDRTE